MTSSTDGTAAERRRPGRPRRAPAVTDLGRLRQDLVQFYGFIGLSLRPLRPLVGLVVMQHAEACADSWVRAAEEFPAVRRILGSVAKGGTLAGLAIAHYPIVVAVGVEAGNIPLESPLCQPIKDEIAFVQKEMEAAARAAQQAQSVTPQ